MRVFVVVAGAALVAACAKNSADIAPSYVSPYQLEPLTCDQLDEEAQHVSARAAKAAGAEDGRLRTANG
jgi:hypothetical protein